MRVMFQEQVLPRMRRRNWVARVIVHRKINLFGRGESDIEAEAMDLTARDRVPEVGITAHDATISFRIRGEGATREEALRQTEPTAALIRQRFGDLVLGEGSVDVPEAVFAELERTGATLATAESCTGGLIAHLITAIAGVSPYYLGGVVSYSNEAKSTLLDVPPPLIEAHGAVSAEVAAAMATGRVSGWARTSRSRRRAWPDPPAARSRSPWAWFTLAWPPRRKSRPGGSTSAPNSRATSSSVGPPRSPSTGSASPSSPGPTGSLEQAQPGRERPGKVLALAPALRSVAVGPAVNRLRT